jgi:hypothetical protein
LPREPARGATGITAMKDNWRRSRLDREEPQR